MISKNLFYTTSALILVLQMGLTFPGLAMDKNNEEEKKFTTVPSTSSSGTLSTSTGSSSTMSSPSSSSSEPTSPSSSSVLRPNEDEYGVAWQYQPGLAASMEGEDAIGGGKRIVRTAPVEQAATIDSDAQSIFSSFPPSASAFLKFKDKLEKMEQEARNSLFRAKKEMIIAEQQYLLEAAKKDK
jgi:hypothetical protein